MFAEREAGCAMPEYIIRGMHKIVIKAHLISAELLGHVWQLIFNCQGNCKALYRPNGPNKQRILGTVVAV